MKLNTLGRTDLSVSEICLGSMTWGTQNTEAEGHQQMDIATDYGVNFIDTAELYPTTPLSAETQGRTESIIGSWMKARGNRDQVVIATKVTGKGPKWIHRGIPINAEKINAAIDQSLARLQTDYIDLYQLHWANRNSYHFRQSWQYDPTHQDTEKVQANMLEVLETLQKLINAGKIRHVGLSNETCWGTSQWLSLAEQHSLPRMVSIQNEYSLMHRLFDLDFAELSHHENVGLLAFSPLAAGLLSGKYRDGVVPANSRLSMQSDLSGRLSEHSAPVLERYLALAEQHHLHPAQMSLKFCMSRPFMTSTIIGATTVEQLKTNLESVDCTLNDDVIQGIYDIHRSHPIPM